MKGFFQETVWTKQKAPLSLVPQCSACGIYKTCKSPKMKVSGKGRRNILIIGEAPGEREDSLGRAFLGNAGIKLEQMLNQIGVNLHKDCYITNALICRPINNRTPTSREIDYCRPNLSKTLLELKPDVVIPLGEIAIQSIMALAWKDGQVDSGKISKWMGWQIPCQKLNTWICPTYHPSFLLHKNMPAAELHVLEHLRKAFSHHEKPWKEKPDWSSKIRVIMDDTEAASEIAKYQQAEMVAVDLETTTLKPDGKYARILCCSVSDGGSAIAYPWLRQSREATGRLIRSRVAIIAANLRFEQRWFLREFGYGVKKWLWDTVLGAHWLNCRTGICGLKFQSFVLLGSEDYSSHLDKYMKSKKGKDSNLPNRLIEVEPYELYKYCALDSYLEVLVAQAQMRYLQ